MPNRTIYIYVNGILTIPGKSDNWTGKAVTFTHINTSNRAEKVAYFSLPLFSRFIFQKARAKKLRKTLERYIDRKWNIILVAHSNGCDVALDCLKEMDWPRIEKLILISPACKADFEKLGLNQTTGLIGEISVLMAGSDKAMVAAGTTIGKLMGYGTLGRSGPVNCTRENVTTIVEKEFGHSDWFNKENFTFTMAGMFK